jgi:hypothetical protein
MTINTDKEDEQWLNAVAGQTDLTADPKINQQAQSLRRALKARSDTLTSQVPIADDAQYQQILFRLRREGLASSPRNWPNPKLWGMVATVIMGIGVVIQIGGFDQSKNEHEILRGGEHATVLIVPDPEARLIELHAGLHIAGVVPEIVRMNNGQIVLTVKATDKVLAYLLTQRLEPEISHGQLVLKLSPSKSKE